jgi:hypothetical protein
MAEQNIIKIKNEYEESLKKKKELIETIQMAITSGNTVKAQLTVGTFPYCDIKLKVLDWQERLKMQIKYQNDNAWYFTNHILPEYEKQMKDFEENFDTTFQKAKHIVDSNDMKAKNFELLKQVIEVYDNPEDKVDFKFLLYKSLKSLL